MRHEDEGRVIEACECAVASVNLKFLSRFISFLPLLPIILCLETLYLVLDCFALVLYHRTFKQRYNKAYIA